MIKKNIKSKPVIKSTKLVAKYIGSKEIYFPSFKKIVNKGELVPEMPLDEARARRDFIIISKED